MVTNAYASGREWETRGTYREVILSLFAAVLTRCKALLDSELAIIDLGGLMPDYVAELSKLYRLQAEIGDDRYLHSHSRNSAVIRRQANIFERCQNVLRDAHIVLDWGCRQAADACMVRMLRGAEVEIHGCDVEPLEYRAFFDFSGLKYSQLTHPYRLPYDDSSFDAVIGSGVLEHVPIDSESLKELYRIIRPQGHLIITHLPNKYSYTEWLTGNLETRITYGSILWRRPGTCSCIMAFYR